MAANFSQNYNVNASVDQLRSIIMDPRFATDLRISLKSENREPDRIWYRFHHGVTMTSWGEKITITLTPLQNGMTSLHIHSECGMPTQIIDWGKNKKVVNNIYAFIEKNLRVVPTHAPNVQPTATQSAPTQASAQPPIPPTPNPPSVETPKFCCNCGKPLDGTANFCSYCGSPINAKAPFCK